MLQFSSYFNDKSKRLLEVTLESEIQLSAISISHEVETRMKDRKIDNRLNLI